MGAERVQRAHFLLGKPAFFTTRGIESGDARGGRVCQECIHVEGQDTVGVADLLVDVLSVEVAVSLTEVLEATEFRIFDEVNEGRVGADRVAGGEVAQVTGSSGHTGNMGEVDTFGDESAHERGRVGVAHAAAFEHEGRVVDGDHRGDGFSGGRIVFCRFLHLSTLPPGVKPTRAYVR